MESTDISVRSEVEYELRKLLSEGFPKPQQLDAQFAKLADRLGSQVYAELLFALCRLRFFPEIAQAHWHGILRHWNVLSERLGSPVDLRVALLDYFVTVNQGFCRPNYLEIQIDQVAPDSRVRDSLTGLRNYECFRSELDREIARADRSGTPLSLALFAVDDFKWYNDRNGYPEGNKALRTVASVIEKHVRKSDLAARYGGETFAALFPGATRNKALEIAERICREIASQPVPHAEHQPSGKFIVSGGVACYGEEARDAVGLISAATSALDRAKLEGRGLTLHPSGEHREHGRVEVDVPGVLQLLASQPEPFRSTNLSEHGLQIHCKAFIPEGAYFRFSLGLPLTDGKVEGTACTVRPAKRSGMGYEIGAQIVQISERDFATLREYLDLALTGSQIPAESKVTG